MKEAESKTVKLDFEDWRYDSWEYSVGGDTFLIEKGGTKVPAEKADELIAASQNTEAVLHKV